MNQDWLNQIQANMQSAQHQFLWFWIVLTVVELVAVGFMAYVLYWFVELMKAAIRALDR